MLGTLAALCGAALIGLLVYGVSALSPSRTLDQALANGERPLAPDARLALPLLGGGGLQALRAHRGEVVVLNFWASWCPPCEEEAPLLERAQARLLHSRATVVGIAYKDTTSDSQAFVRRYRLSYPNLRDSAGTFAHAYGTDKLPETFVIDREGRVAAISRGEVDAAFIARAIALAQGT
ncbi:MAG TPA: TlpA disulfide reductase family protein [Usitatibacter sp.]|nr:TlpA disulfide reductase family protein [Usitatibacter sp.]